MGNDDYNKTLSGRRAAAVYGLLVRDPVLWEKLFSNKFGNDIWGDDAIATMNSRLAEDDASKASKLQFGSGKIDDGDSGSGSAAASSSQDQSQPPSSPIDGAATDAGRTKTIVH